MKYAIGLLLIIVTMPLVAADIAELSPEMWNRVRAAGSLATDIQPPATLQAPAKLSLVECLDFACRYNAGFRQDQKDFIDARGKLWVAEQKVFYTVSGTTGYEKTNGGDTEKTLSGDMDARWERTDGSSVRASLGAGSSKSFGDFFSKSPSLSVSYERPLYRGVGLASSTAERIRKAQSTLWARELSFYDAYQELAQNVIEDYCDALLARGEAEIAQRAVERAKHLYDINYAKFSGEGLMQPGEVWVSQVAEIDVDQARLSWERSKQQLISRQQSYRDAMDRLLLTIGATPGASPELSTAIRYTPQDYNETALTQTALANSTEIGRLKLDREDTHAALRIARSERLPDVIAGVGIDGLGGSSGDSDNGTGWFTSIRVEMPLNSRVRTEDVDREDRALRVLEHRILAEGDAVTQEIQRQVRAATSARQRIDIGEQSLALAKKSREAAQGMYDEGLSDYLRVLNAEDKLVEAERSLLQEHMQYFLTTVRIRRALGESIVQAMAEK